MKIKFRFHDTRNPGHHRIISNATKIVNLHRAIAVCTAERNNNTQQLQHTIMRLFIYYAHLFYYTNITH